MVPGTGNNAEMVDGASSVRSGNPQSFVGRRDELSAIADALADPACPGAVLVGPSGVGKTTLARHALRTAEASGFATAAILATQAAATIPLGAVEPIVGDELGAGSLALLRSARARVRSLAGGGPFVLLVDDAHLLDNMSATLVHQLAGDDNVFVIATLTSGTVAPDPMTALWKDSGAWRVDVSPLDLAGTEELMTAILGGSVGLSALSRVVRLSHGLPMAVHELVDAARRSGTLSLDDGAWCLSGDLPLSDRLVDLVEARLQMCSEEEREALATIALGEPLSVPVAAAMIADEVLQSLEAKHLILVRGSSGDMTVAHPLYGEVALAGLGQLHRRRKLTTLADTTIERADPSAATDLRVAMWRLAAGADVGADEMLRGAEAAYRASDHRTTADLASAAWERDPSPEAGHLLGLALGRLTRAEEAETVLSETTTLLDGRPIDDRMTVLVALARSENIFRGLNDAVRAIEGVEAAEAKVSDDAWRDELVGHRAMLILQAGRVSDALRLAEPLLADGTPDRPFVKAAYAAGIGLVYAGRTDRATELAQQALPIHERIWADDLYQTEPGVHHVTAILALVERGDLVPAEAYADIAVQEVAEAWEGYGLAFMSTLAGLTATRRGKMRTARRRCLDAVPLFRAAGYPSPMRWALAGAATADALTGDLDSARRRMAAVDDLAEMTPVRLRESHIEEARAWVQLAGGDLTAAQESLARGIERALAGDELVSAAHLMHSSGRIGAAAEMLIRLEALSDRIDGDFQRLREAHLRALAVGDGSQLDQVAGAFAHVGADLLAAEAAAEAVRAHRQRGDQRAATRSARFSEAHAALCEGARTPSMTVTHALEPLTDREREISLLAATGLSSKDIAERLAVSRRTVDNHLQRVFAKLGISGRHELSGALGRDSR